MDGLHTWWRTRDRVLVMGVLNVTPDSFYDGGRWSDPVKAGKRALDMIDEGADIIDVGGESSRPGARPVPGDVERDRVAPIISWLTERTEVPVSVDTTKAAVADAALEAGAIMVNDISAMRFDPEMASTVARHGAAVVLMHMQGTPGTMQQDPRYTDPVREVRSFLEDRLRAALEAGIARDRIVVDPGIGFGKRLEHNLALLAGVSEFVSLGVPVLVGLSRKSFLGELLGVPSQRRLVGTVAANAVAIARGADLIRVHDVREGRWTADVAFRVRTAAGRS